MEDRLGNRPLDRGRTVKRRDRLAGQQRPERMEPTDPPRGRGVRVEGRRAEVDPDAALDRPARRPDDPRRPKQRRIGRLRNEIVRQPRLGRRLAQKSGIPIA
jgi:hypothetical protein